MRRTLSGQQEQSYLAGPSMDTMHRLINPLGRPLPHNTKTILKNALLGMVIILLSTACAGQQATRRQYAVGETAEVNGWHITVHSFSILPTDRWHQPTEGCVFCAVELTLENHSRQIRFFMPEKQMLLVHGDRRAHSLDHSAGVLTARVLNWTVPDGEMSIGESAHGAAAYEIPSSATGLRWVFRSSLFPWSPKVTFALGELP